MKTMGLIGGMSWESTVTYYEIINETVKKELGGLHSAKCILHSVDFQEIADFQKEGKWDESTAVLSDAAKNLEKAGADFIIICTNTMHKVVDQIQKNISIPILHIADTTSKELLEDNIKKVALLGTCFTMEEDFYKQKLADHGLSVLVPNEKDRAYINKVIYDELCLGVIKPESKKGFLEIINNLSSEGVEGIILGCTEIGLLIQQSDTTVPLFDTAEIHAKEAVYYAINKNN